MAAKQGLLYAAAATIDRIAQAHRSAAAAAIRELEVSESAASLLWLLSDTPGATMTQAAAQLSCDRSNITLLATQLEKRGLVERTADPLDARRRNLRLTPAGDAAATHLRDAVTAGSPLRHLSPTACADLVALLRASLTPGQSQDPEGA